MGPGSTLVYTQSSLGTPGVHPAAGPAPHGHGLVRGCGTITACQRPPLLSLGESLLHTAGGPDCDSSSGFRDREDHGRRTDSG